MQEDVKHWGYGQYGHRMLCMFYCYTGLTVIVILDYHMWTMLICFVKYHLYLLIEHLVETSFIIISTS